MCWIFVEISSILSEGVHSRICWIPKQLQKNQNYFIAPEHWVLANWFSFFPFLCPSPSTTQVYRKAVSQMSQGLIRRLTVLSQYEEALVKINATAAERLTALKAKPQASIQRDMLSICNDPFTVAQQLTHIELVRAVALDLLFFIPFESRTMPVALLKSVIGPDLAQRANLHRSYL